MDISSHWQGEENVFIDQTANFRIVYSVFQ